MAIKTNSTGAKPANMIHKVDSAGLSFASEEATLRSSRVVYDNNLRYTGR